MGTFNSTFPVIVTIFVISLWKSVLMHAAVLPHNTPDGRIVGGHEAIPHSFPYQVSLQIRVFFLRAHVCGGSILNENWVLTAGHCVKGSWLLALLPLDAIAGAHDMFEYGPHAQIANVEKRIAHPLYNGEVGPNDIAVVKTKTPFKFSKQIQPIQLPTKAFKSDEMTSKATLTGWGLLRTSFWPDIPRKLQEVQVPILSYNECLEAVEKILEPGEINPLNEKSNICSGPLTGGVAGCNGDSGGPLVRFLQKTKITEDSLQLKGQNLNRTIADKSISGKTSNEALIPVVVGVVSWGATPCGEEGAPTVYTKVSNYIDFINSHIN